MAITLNAGTATSTPWKVLNGTYTYSSSTVFTVTTTRTDIASDLTVGRALRFNTSIVTYIKTVSNSGSVYTITTENAVIPTPITVIEIGFVETLEQIPYKKTNGTEYLVITNSSGTIDRSITGNAATASKIDHKVTLALSSGATGSVDFDCSETTTSKINLTVATLNGNNLTDNTVTTTKLVKDNIYPISISGTATNATNITTMLAAGTKAYITGTVSPTTSTGGLIFDNNVYLDTTTGTIKATTFSGNATTATTATNSTNVAVTKNTTNTLYLTGITASNSGDYPLQCRDDTYVTSAGALYAATVWNSVYNDYAEAFTNRILNYGDVKHKIIELDENNNTILANEDSNMVIGVVSDSFGHMMGATQDDINTNKKIPIGLAGVLYVDSIDTVDISNRGKFIVSAGNGYGKVSDEPKIGTCVGKIIGIDEENNRYKIILTLR